MTQMIKLKTLFADDRQAINPLDYVHETFALYSIPSYDSGQPEIVTSKEVGSSKVLLKNQDVLLSRIVPHIRRCWIVSGTENYRSIGSGEWIVFRVPKGVDPKYLRYYFLTEKFEKNFLQTVRGVGGSLLRADPKQVGEFEIPLPPLPIQKKIAAILDKADSLRQKDKQLLEHYKNLAQSIFYDIFGDPVKNEKGWDRVRLGEICSSIKDGPHVSPKYTVDGIPFISVNNIIKGKIDIANAKYISREDFLEYSRKGKPAPGNVLYTKGGTTGFAKRVDVSFDFMNWVHIAVLKLKKDIVNDVFLESMLNSQYCYVQSQKYTRGIANRDLVLGQMAKIEMFLPPLDLQKAFSKRLVLIEKQLDFVASQKEKTEHLFQSLLQKAFKGELVKEP